MLQKIRTPLHETPINKREIVKREHFSSSLVPSVHPKSDSDCGLIGHESNGSRNLDGSQGHGSVTDLLTKSRIISIKTYITLITW